MTFSVFSKFDLCLTLFQVFYEFETHCPAKKHADLSHAT